MSHSSVVLRLTWALSMKASASYESGTVVLKTAWHQTTAMEHLRFGVICHPLLIRGYTSRFGHIIIVEMDRSNPVRSDLSVFNVLPQDTAVFNVLAVTGYSRLQRAGCHTVQPSSTCWLSHGTAVFNVLAVTRYSRLQRAGCHTIQPQLTGINLTCRVRELFPESATLLLGTVKFLAGVLSLF